MSDDRLDASLRGLGDRLTEGLATPSYETIERRRIRRRRGQTIAAFTGIAAIAGIAIGVVPVLADRGSPTPAAGSPRVVVTVTVAAPVRGVLSLRDVIFDSTGRGVLLGQRCDPGGRCDTVVLSSTDSGDTFGDEQIVTRVDVVGPTKITMGPGSLVVAYDPGLYVSKDGGRSWSNLTPTGYAIHDVVSRSTTFTALAVSIDDRAELLQVPQARLGQDPFTHVVIDRANASARLQEDGSDLVVVAPDTGGTSSQILIREPTSSTWRSVQTPPCPAPSFSAPTSKAWWLVCTGSSEGDGRTKTTYFSTDSGATWTPLTPVPHPGNGGTVTAVSALIAYVSGPDSPLYVTHDGGESWQVALQRTGAGYGQPHTRRSSEPVGGWVTSGRSVWRLGTDGVWRETRLN